MDQETHADHAGHEPSAELAAIEAGAISKMERIDHLLQQWIVDCVNNGPASRDTAGYNHFVTSALPELRRRLLLEIA